MKLLSPGYLTVIVAVATLFALSCKKKPFKSDTGMFGLKQYHNYSVNILGRDTTLIKDEKIKLLAMANSNYVTWDTIEFHLSADKGDSAKVFIKDSLIGSTRHILYTLSYSARNDQVKVWNEAGDLYWVSF